MADNRAQFIRWWKGSMRVIDACENLERMLQSTKDDPARIEAEKEFMEALSARHKLLVEHYRKLHNLNETVIEQAEVLRKEVHVGQTQTSINTISHSARSLQSTLEMMAFPKRSEEDEAA